MDLFVQLNLARKVGEYCSSDHPQCLQATTRAAEIVNSLEDKDVEVIFSAGEGTISAGKVHLEPAEPYLADFAAALRAAGITLIRLTGGVSADGLVRLTHLLAACSDPQMGAAQIRRFLCGPVAEGIRVGMAPSADPADQPAAGKPSPEEAIWKADVRSLLGVKAEEDRNGDQNSDPNHQAGGEGEHAESVILADIDPLQLAKFINNLDFSYEIDLIAGHFLVPYLQQTMDRGTRKESMVPAQTVTRFLHVLREFSPGHQLRFITAALEISHRFTLFAGAILEAVPIHLAVKAFDGIKVEENTVHPQIADRFKSLCRLTGWSGGRFETAAAEKGEDQIDFKSGEESMFDSSPAESSKGGLGSATGQPLLGQKIRTAFTSEFAEAGKRKALIRVYLDLLERSASLDETRACSDTLPGLFTEALNENDWAGLHRSWIDLTELVKRGQKTRPFLTTALQRIRKSFLTIQAMDQIVSGIENETAETRTVIEEWLPALGNAAGEMLILALIESNNRNQRRNLLSAIVSLGEAAIPLALKRINDHRWYVVRNMISIIREVGDKRAGEDILTLSGHAQFQVRRELINTLLTLDHPEGLELAEKGIKGNDRKMRSACIGLLGSHRVSGARTVLLQILGDKLQGGVPFSQAQKTSAVWALGQIGDGTVLPMLHRLLKKQWLFKSASSHELKMAILRSLPGFPLREVQPLARWGANHGDEDEAIGCSKLLKDIAALPEERST